MATPAAAVINVEVVSSDHQRHTQTQALTLPLGATVADALHAADVVLPPGGTVAVWGKHRALDTRLEPADRVAVLRPLTVNPMEARRRRQDHQRRARLKLGLKAGVKPALADARAPGDIATTQEPPAKEDAP